MNKHQQIENRFKKARIRLDDQANRIVLQSLLSQWQQMPVPAFKARKLRRKIMIRKVSKFTAAIVLLVICLSIFYFGKTNSSVALGDVLQSMSDMPWLHANIKIKKAGHTEISQQWESFNPKIIIKIDKQGVISYRDYRKQILSVYNPDANTITLSPITDRLDRKGAQSPAEGIRYLIASFESRAGEVKREISTQNNIPVEIIYLKDDHQEMSLVLDIKRQVALAMTNRAMISDNSQEFVVVSVDFDYPDQGPQTIYDLDVPAKAKIIDYRPKGKVQDLIQKVQNQFDAGFEDHIAVVFKSWVNDQNQLEPSSVTVMRQKGNLKRVDRYHAYNFTGTKQNIPTMYPLIKDNWLNLMIPDVIALEDNKYGEFQLIFDGSASTLRTSFSGKVNVRIMRVNMFNAGEASESLAGLTRCSPSILMMSGADNTVKSELLKTNPEHPDWVGFKLVTSMHNTRIHNTTKQRISSFWFDPARDYICMERQTIKITDQGTLTFISKVLDTACTSKGTWYSRLIRITNSTPDYKGKMHHSVYEKRILVNTNPVFKANVFDGAVLQ